MTGVLFHGHLPLTESAIFIATTRTSIKKFFLINNSTSGQTININRVVDNDIHNVFKIDFYLPSGWSIDILDPGDEWNLVQGDFIRARCSGAGAVKYIVDGTLP